MASRSRGSMSPRLDPSSIPSPHQGRGVAGARGAPTAPGFEAGEIRTLSERPPRRFRLPRQELRQGLPRSFPKGPVPEAHKERPGLVPDGPCRGVPRAGCVVPFVVHAAGAAPPSTIKTPPDGDPLSRADRDEYRRVSRRGDKFSAFFLPNGGVLRG